MIALTRFVLLLGALGLAAIIIAAHGARGVGLLIAVALVASVPQTRVWRGTERMLVRLTGSRRRAAAVALGLVIVTLVTINLYEFFS
jgi:Flp pilus assembly protein TadB